MTLKHQPPETLELPPEGQTADGFVVMTQVDGSAEPGFRDDSGRVVVHAKERDAQLEIIDCIEEEIRQFRAGERAFDELSFISQDWVDPATLHADGRVTTEDDEFPPAAS